MQEVLDCYRGLPVFVTGHTGFKGTWLTEWLALLGAEVTGYSLDPPSKPNMYEALGTDKRIRDLRGDICDGAGLAAAVADAQPRIVFHLAAQPIVRASYADPRETFETNVMGTVHLLDAVRATESVAACVVVTSDKCYENREVVQGYRESDPMGGFDPYSASKGCAELVTSSYRRSFFAHSAAVATARSGNVIGGGDWGADRILPDCARALSQEQPVVLRRPHAVRPWQHVLDPLSGYLVLGARLLASGHAFARPWNFGPSDARLYTVEDIVSIAVDEWGAGRYDVDGGPQPHEAGLLRLDIGQAAYYLGWTPQIMPPDAVRQTMRWYKHYYENGGGASLLTQTRDEIEVYMSALRIASPRVPSGTEIENS